MSGVVVDPLAYRSIFEDELRIQGILTGGLDLRRKVGRPTSVEAAWSGRACVVANLFVQPSFAKNRAHFANEIPQDVGVVHSGVDGNRTGVLHVPPWSDGNAVAAADVRFDHEPRLANRPIVDQCSGQAVDRIAPIVLCH